MTGTQLNTALSRIVDSFVADNTHALDDDLSDLLQDSDVRDEAVDSLIDYIEHNREYL